MRRPKKPTDSGLDGRDRRRLAKALHGIPDARTYRRVLAILCLAQGLLAEQVTRLIGTSGRSIYRWLGRYKQDQRIDDLQDQSRSGRPPVAKTISNARIAREVRKNPMRLGYRTTGWTVDLLARHLANRYDCPISARTLRRRLDQMGLAWKRPRYRYGKPKNLPQKKGRLSAA